MLIVTGIFKHDELKYSLKHPMDATRYSMMQKQVDRGEVWHQLVMPTKEKISPQIIDFIDKNREVISGDCKHQK